MFKKVGLLPIPGRRPPWMHSHAYLPSAFLLNPEVIRIVVAFWDARGIGRVGHIDTLTENPLKVVAYSETPALDIGEAGAFDDNGVSPLCLVQQGGKLHLYYAGWQLSHKVRYFLFTGLATSTDMGVTFQRLHQTPVLDRCDEALTIRTGGFVYPAHDGWSMIYGSGSGTVTINHKQLPTYELRHISSRDGIAWPRTSAPVFAPDQARGEYGFGRPHVLCEGGTWKMWYGIRSLASGYSMGYAESHDGRSWKRLDARMTQFNNDGWVHDRAMRTFPSIVATGAGAYLFYNGNNYGEQGICVARRTPG